MPHLPPPTLIILITFTRHPTLPALIMHRRLKLTMEIAARLPAAKQKCWKAALFCIYTAYLFMMTMEGLYKHKAPIWQGGKKPLPRNIVSAARFYAFIRRKI